MVFDAFSTYYAHVNRTASFIAKHGPLSDAFAVLRSKEFRDSLLKNHKNGSTILEYMKNTLTAFQGLEVRSDPTTVANTIVRSIIRAAHVSALGFKPQIAMYQGASIAAASMEIELKYLLAGGATSLSPTLIAEMKEWSATLRHRLESGGHQILSPGYQGSALMEFFGATHRDYAGSAKDSLDKSAMSMIKKGDTTVIATIWGAVKLEAKEKGLVEGTDEFKAYVSNRTVDIVDQTQPTWDVLTSSQMQNAAKHNAFFKLLVMFSSQRNKNFNMVMRAVSDYSSSKTKTPAETGRLVGKLFTVLGVQSAMVFYSGKSWFFLLACLYGDDDELEKYSKDSWYDDIIGIGQKSLGNWLIGGDMVNMFVDSLRQDSSLPPSYRRNRGTILVGIKDDLLDGSNALVQGTMQWMDDERYPGLGPRAGRRKYIDTLSKSVDKLMAATGMMTGLPTGAAKQMFGRLMPHRRPVKWAYEPVNQLNKLDTEWQRAGREISDATKKLEEKRGDRPALRAIIANAEKVQRDNHVAHEIWTHAESNVLKNLADAKKGRKVDEALVALERTRLEHLADEYQSYAKTKDVRGLIKTAGPAFLGTFVMDYTRPVPKVDPLRSRKRREEKVVDIAEARSLAKPLVEAMTFKQADVALRWGYMKSMDRPGLNVLAAGFYANQRPGVTARKALALVMEMEKSEVIGIILSKVYPYGPLAGEPVFIPETLGFDRRYDALRKSIGNR
jgi:hypothetical protein